MAHHPPVVRGSFAGSLPATRTRHVSVHGFQVAALVLFGALGTVAGLLAGALPPSRHLAALPATAADDAVPAATAATAAEAIAVRLLPRPQRPSTRSHLP